MIVTSMVDRAEKQQTPGALWPHRLVERMGGPAPVSISTWPRNAKSSERSQSRRTRSSSLLLILKFNAGGVLLSHTLPGAVPSAQVGLASGFGKGPGVTPPQKPPTNTTEQHTPNNTHRVLGVPCHSRHCITDANNNPKCTFTTCVCFTQPTSCVVCYTSAN